MTGPGFSHKGTDSQVWGSFLPCSSLNSPVSSLLSGAMTLASSSPFSFPYPVPHPPEVMPTLGHCLGTDPHTVSHLTWEEFVSCPPDLGMLVSHFALGSAHLVHGSLCVLPCHLCTPHFPEYTCGHTTVGTSRMKHLWIAA